MRVAALCLGLMLRGAAAAEVTALPGLEGGMTSRMFSGYLQAAPDHFLFYVLVESKSKPSTDPLMIWSNGGPGCSSLLGFFTEHGPYLITNEPYTLVSNQYSWNAAANYLYIEHPIGVGFSYSTHRGHYADLGDDKEADELYAALLDFYTQFPDYKGRDLYLTGESCTNACETRTKDGPRRGTRTVAHAANCWPRLLTPTRRVSRCRGVRAPPRASDRIRRGCTACELAARLSGRKSRI